MKQVTRSAVLFALTALVLAVSAAAPASAQEVMRITGSKVGILTSNPDKVLHLKGDSADLKVKVENTSAVTGGRELFELKNNGGVTFIMIDDTGDTWKFLAETFTGTPGFSITRQGSGVREFRIAPDGDVYLNNGKVHEASSRELKQGFESVDAAEILDRVVSLPVTTWSYKKNDGVRHIGPVAEDFYSAFHVGIGEQHLNSGDATGVALAAIQGLHGLVQEKDQEIQRLNSRIDRLEALVEGLAAGGSR